MISLEVIEREINELEGRDTTYNVCERLSWLYTVRDHLMPQDPVTVTDTMSGSEFLRATSGISYHALMNVIDEHMSALAVVNPREYESVMDRIKALR